MNRPWKIGIAVLCAWASAAIGQDLYKTTPGPYAVQSKDLDWRDEARGRNVAVRVYEPKSAHVAPEKAAKGRGVEKFPVVVFSHGLGASRNSYGYFCEHLASEGYLVIAPTHEGSDTAALREGVREHREHPEMPGFLQESTSDPENLKGRALDVTFVLDHVGKDATYGQVADLSRVGVAGHSFGAHTAMEMAGMTVDLPGEPDVSFRDPRVKAVLPMSPQGAGVMGVDRGAWGHVAVPVLFLTGTKDYGRGNAAATWRREAFDSIQGVEEYLVVLNDATHGTFAQGPGLRLRPEHAHHVEMIESLSTAFFDAYVKGEAKAKQWLQTFASKKHDDCTAEMKAGR
jgi:predicted dienelactone hydrolase